MSDPFVTQDELEMFMGDDGTPAVLDDDLATLALNAAMASVRRFLGQEITYVADDVVELDGSGRDSMVLPQRPVRDLTVIVENGADQGALDFDTVYLLRDGILYKRCGCWLVGRGNVKLTYSHGWDVEAETSSGDDENQIPADIILVTLGAARRAYNDGGEFAQDVAGETIGNYAYTAAASEAITEAAKLLKGEELILGLYRLHRVV